MLKGKKAASQVPTRTNRDLASHSSLTEQPYGVKVLVSGVNPTIEYVFHYHFVAEEQCLLIPQLSLVAVHGLDGHPERTWTAENGVSWLREYLPEVIPSARILAFGYDGRTHDSTPLSCQKLHEHAISLVTDLTLYRRSTDVCLYTYWD